MRPGRHRACAVVHMNRFSFVTVSGKETASCEKLNQAWIQTGFQRFTEIGQHLDRVTPETHKELRMGFWLLTIPGNGIKDLLRETMPKISSREHAPPSTLVFLKYGYLLSCIRVCLYLVK